MNQRKDSMNSLNIQILQKTKTGGQRYKSGFQMVLFGLIISIAALMFGYGLVEVSTISINVLITEYNIPISASVAQGLLIGIMPFGGIFGAILFSFVLQKLSRRTSIFFTAFWMIVSIILVQIKTVQTLFLGRFIEGLCLGLYVSIAPIYLRELIARQLRPQIMSLFSMGKIVGIVTAYSLQNILQAVGYQYSFRILLGFNGVFCVLQIVLVFFFVPHSAVQMVQRRDFIQAKKIISQLYNEEYIEQVLDEMKLDYQAEKAKTKPANDISNLVAAAVSYTKNRKRALMMAIHICSFRQFIGANVLVTFSGQIVAAFPNLQKASVYTGLMINCMQLFTNSISLFTISKMVGKRPIFLGGCIGLTVLNFGLALSLFFSAQTMILVMMSLYMLLYGATFLPVSWSYPSQIIPAQQAVFANTLGWVATCIVVSVPPIIVGAMPNNNAYPLFFFFGFYGIFGSLYVFCSMVESKGRTYEQIIKEY